MRIKRIALLLGLLVGLTTGYGQGDLLVSPIRIVFEGKKMNQEIVLVNTGRDTATYNVSFIQNRAKENGSYERIETPDPGQYFASDYVRFFPRKFTLAPGEPQILRMQFRRTPDLKDGEYRSHLYFRAEPPKIELGAETNPSEETSGISINLIPIYGVSIPVIIRYGEVNAKITSTEPELEMKNDSTALLRFTMLREGNCSVYGNINILYDGPGNRSEILKVLNGLSIFTPNPSRSFEIEFPKPPDVDLSKGKITIRYSSSNDAKQETYVTKVLQLDS